jgi:hypothetical protein
MKHLLICLSLLCPFAAMAQPSSMADCERIKNDLAYNECLASFGPKRGEQPVRAAADEDEGPTARAPGARGPVTRRGGRQTAVFDVVSDDAARATRSARQRR